MIDANLIFDGTVSGTGTPTGVAITATRDSTNILDLLVARDVGAGEDLGVHVTVTEAFATLTSLTIDLQVGATAGGTFYGIQISEVIPVAQLILGAPIYRYALPVNQILNAAAGVLRAPGRFLKLVYTVAGSNATTGKVFSFVTPRGDRQEYYTYPAAYVTH